MDEVSTLVHQNSLIKLQGTKRKNQCLYSNNASEQSKSTGTVTVCFYNCDKSTTHSRHVLKERFADVRSVSSHYHCVLIISREYSYSLNLVSFFFLLLFCK